MPPALRGARFDGREGIPNVDITTEEGITNLLRGLEGSPGIDVLILNSGYLSTTKPEDPDFASETLQSLHVNAVAPVVVLHTLLAHGKLHVSRRASIVPCMC